MEAAESDWLAAFDKAKLTPRYYATIALLVLQEMFEFYDFFVVGFIVAVIGPGWHLTYGQSAIMLLAAGVGAIVGALAFGRLSDRFGRRSLTAWAGVFFSAGAAGCALLPDGAWIGFSLFRFLVGFGLAGAVATQNALIIEMTPTRHRTFVSSLMVAPVSFGTLLAATVSSHAAADHRLARPGGDGSAADPDLDRPAVRGAGIRTVAADAQPVRRCTAGGRQAARRPRGIIGVARDGAEPRRARAAVRVAAGQEALLVGAGDLGWIVHGHLRRAALGSDHPSLAAAYHGQACRGVFRGVGAVCDRRAGGVRPVAAVGRASAFRRDHGLRFDADPVRGSIFSIRTSSLAGPCSPC